MNQEELPMRRVRVLIRYDVTAETDYPTNIDLEDRLDKTLPNAVADLLHPNATVVGYVEVEDA